MQTSETPPSQAVPVPAQAPRLPVPEDKPSLRLDFFGSISRHKILGLLSFLIVLAVGLPVAYVKGKPKYSTAAVVFVSPRFVANLEDNKEFDLQSNSQYREYVQQNVRTINRFDIIQEALEHLGPAAKLWTGPNETATHATERLQRELQIEPVPDTYQILVSLDGDKPQGLAEVVNSVVDTFMSKTKSEGFYGTDERIRNLREERKTLIERTSANQQRRAELAEQLGVSTFNESFSNPYDKLLVDSKTALADAVRQRIQAEAQLSALVGSSSSTGQKPLQAFAQDLANKDPGLMTFDANLNQRRSQLLSNISGLSPDHPGRRAAEKELKELEAERDRVYNKLIASYSTMLDEERKSDVEKAAKVEQGLTQEVARQAAQASGFSHGYQEAMSLGLDMERERKRVDSIDDRISFLSLESRAPGFVRLFSAARSPEQPVKGGRKKFALFALIAALLFAVVVPVGVDYLDPRVHWPGDVQRVLGFRGIGWLLNKKDAGKDFEREQILRIASRLSQEHEVNKSQIFAFTAVKPKSGTTTIVNEVACALTRLGMPTLAVEANAYRSDPVYRSPKSRGLTVVLRGQSDIKAEIVPGTEDLADHIPVGDVAKFESLPDLHNLIQVLRGATSVYSMILIDLPPILVSVDAELVARSADLLTLIIQAEAVNKGELRRAARFLERLRPTAVSSILNNVQVSAAAGFGRQARDEFYKGAPRTSSYWTSPWLWR